MSFLENIKTVIRKIIMSKDRNREKRQYYTELEYNHRLMESVFEEEIKELEKKKEASKLNEKE